MVFNFLGRDFFNALSERDVDAFQTQLLRYLGGFAVGVPVFVVKRYFQVRGVWHARVTTVASQTLNMCTVVGSCTWGLVGC